MLFPTCGAGVAIIESEARPIDQQPLVGVFMRDRRSCVRGTRCRLVRRFSQLEQKVLTAMEAEVLRWEGVVAEGVSLICRQVC